MELQPWTRIKHPTEIPPRLETLATLTPTQFADTLRSNLLPGDKEERLHWNRYWHTLKTQYHQRATHILENWITLASTAQGHDDPERRRIAKFTRHCHDALIRLGEDATPIVTIERLQTAIRNHRIDITSGADRQRADDELWAVLNDT